VLVGDTGGRRGLAAKGEKGLLAWSLGHLVLTCVYLNAMQTVSEKDQPSQQGTVEMFEMPLCWLSEGEGN
jgi:hypothetical protein